MKSITVNVKGFEIEVQADRGITIMHFQEIHVADACLEKCLGKLLKKIDDHGPWSDDPGSGTKG